MESSTTLPLTPSVETTTALFSLTSRSLRPLHRTTTLMLVSWPKPSTSNSRSLRLVPAVETDEIEGAGEATAARSILEAAAALGVGWRKEDTRPLASGLVVLVVAAGLAAGRPKAPGRARVAAAGCSLFAERLCMAMAVGVGHQQSQRVWNGGLTTMLRAR